MRTLWIVSGGIEALPGIRRAKKMGLYVVVSDRDPDAPGFQEADDRVVVDTYDVGGTVDVAKKYHRSVRPIDGVMCIASDVPLTVAAVAEELGLPGIPVETARMAMDKLAMKEHFVESGIPVPWFSPVESPAHLEDIVRKRGLPLVLKPVDSRGARGVLRLIPGVDLHWAYHYSRTYSPTGRVMVEEFLEGQQISTESVILNGHTFTPGFSDRNYEYLERFAPYIIENGGQQPSGLSEDEMHSVSLLAENAGRNLGVKRGTVKGDIVLTGDGPRVIEMATRLSGGWFATDQIPLATGVDMVGIAIKIALGDEVTEEELRVNGRKGVAIRYFFPEPGRVVSIKGKERSSCVPWIHRLGFFVKPGDIVEPVTDHTKRAGFVITEGRTSQEAVKRAEEVIDSIHIETVPV